jgi:hypothetical protein
MRVSRHIMISTALSGLVYIGTASPVAAVSSFLSGWLIDMDHVIDYLIEHGFRLDRGHFFSTFEQDKYQKIRLIFHGWEWPITLAVLAVLFPAWRMLFAGISFGMLQHLAFDQLFNGASLFGYSIIGRAVTGFEYRKAFPKHHMRNQPPAADRV